MNINLNLYKYFYVVAKNKSFTKAAEELMISQPSLSYSIKTLESQLNISLFKRTSKGIELTNEGINLFNMIEPLMKVFDKINEDGNEFEGKVSVGVRALFQATVNTMFLKTIKKLYPGIDIDIKIRYSDELYNELLNKNVDLIIDEYNYGEISDNIISIKLKEKVCEPQIICGSKFYKNKKLTIDELKNKKLVITKTNKIAKEFIDKYGLTNIENVCSSYVVNERVKEEDVLGLSFSMIIEGNKDINVLETQFDLPQFNLFVSYLKEKRINSKVKTVAEIFSDNTLSDLEKL